MAQIFGVVALTEGNHNYGPFPLADAITRADLQIDITNFLDPAVRVDFLVEDSIDGGASWQTVVGGVLSGGVYVSQITGLPRLTFGAGGRFRAGANRQVRASVAVVGGVANVGPGVLTTTA